MARRRAAPSRSVDRRATTRPRSVVVVVPLPRPLARRVRRVTYVYPRSRVQSTRVVRVPLATPRRRFFLTPVRVVLPAVLPSAQPSSVSIDRGRLNIHSHRQHLRQMRNFEMNRRRYEEHKDAHSKARSGQLSSVRSDRLGIIGAAARRGWSARRLADVAMVSRALGG